MPKPSKKPDSVADHKWYEIRAAHDDEASSATIYIYGDIGPSWNDNSVTAAEFVRDLNTLDVEHIELRINSFGGSVPDGLAIYNALRRHPAAIDVHIDGVALSCASYIAMAGDIVNMAANAQLMIHAPWTWWAEGNAQQLRDYADVLDGYAAGLAHGYAAKSGQSLDDCLLLVSDGRDHWYSANEALEAGFVDVIGDEMPAAAAFMPAFQARHRSISSAAAAAAAHKERTMPQKTAPTPAAEPVQNQPLATPAQPEPAPAPVAGSIARDREANQQLLAMFKPFLAQAGVEALQIEMLADPSVPLADVQAKLLAKLGEGAAPLTPVGAYPRVETVEAERDKRKTAAAAALMVRAGLGNSETREQMNGNPFRGMKLLDIARDSLERAGVGTRGMGQMEVAGLAFTTSTSDFPVLLENAMHGTLLGAYALAPLTWPRFCKRGSVSDFRAHKRYLTGVFGALDTVTELEEYKNKAIPDGQSASITANTKGNVINLSRQAIINDDLGAFLGLATSLGSAAARTVEAEVYALLALNAGMGPTLGAAPLFDATHNNLATGGAISVSIIDDARKVLASQKDVANNDYLDLKPVVLLVPTASGGTARVINDAEYDPDTVNKLQRPNMVRGLFRDVVDSPRLSGTRFYLFADPNDAPVIEVAFLDGNDKPYLELQNGFDVDGARYKVRLDFGVAAIDWRGAVTGAGA